MELLTAADEGRMGEDGGYAALWRGVWRGKGG